MKKLLHKIYMALFRFFKGSYVLTMQSEAIYIGGIMVLGVFKSKKKATQYMKNFDYSFGRQDRIVSVDRDIAHDYNRYVVYKERVGPEEIVLRSCYFYIDWGPLNG